MAEQKDLKSLMSSRELKGSNLWNKTEDYFLKLLEPGFGKVTRAADLVASPDGKYLAFTGSIWEKLEGLPDTRICIVDAEAKAMRVVTDGPHHDRLPQFSPDGRYISFLSDRSEVGAMGIFIASFKDGKLGDVESLPSFQGLAEYHLWSPDSSQLLVGVAGEGSDKPGAGGSGKTIDKNPKKVPEWVPEVDAGIQDNQWRSLWVYDTASRQFSQVTPRGLNIWDGNWCGSDHVVAVVSDSPLEGAWYSARVSIMNIVSGEVQDAMLPVLDDQYSKPVASQSGRKIGIIRALCSDRNLVVGNVQVFDVATKTTVQLDTNGTDVTSVYWVDEGHLLYIGLKGLKTVFGHVDVLSGTVVESLSTEYGCGGWLPEAAPIGVNQVAAILEGRDRAQEIAIIQDQGEKVVWSFEHEGTSWLRARLGISQSISWKAEDNLEIEGFLTLPKTGNGPFPLILVIHGGPIYTWQNRWFDTQLSAILVSRGYAVLNPNPRGSSGRGQDFTRMVYGDMGGGDHKDLLAGIDYLVEKGIADNTRIGITGGSYGGFMSAWAVTQSDRFAASVAVAAVTDWQYQHTVSNIPEFDQILLKSSVFEIGGEYQKRSPLLHAGKVKTPVLQIAGKDDHCVPYAQSMQFHNALLENGVESVLTVYSGEAHGVRKFPAYIDYCARVVGWFERFMPAQIGVESK